MHYELFPEWRIGLTHAKFTIENVDEAAEDYDEVEAVPRITEIVLVIPMTSVSKEKDGEKGKNRMIN